MIDYTIFYKTELPLSKPWPMQWDVFISGYVPAERVTHVYDNVNAVHKWWWLFPEYRYSPAERPNGSCYHEPAISEADFVVDAWDRLAGNLGSGRICIDMTGFIRPYLMCLIRWLVKKGIKSFDVLYAEPQQYALREETIFSADVRGVRQVVGFEGIHSFNSSNDLLVIGSGYEDTLITHVAEDKLKAHRMQVIGFPSLRADMYQENILCIDRAETSIGAAVSEERDTHFAPANDPFVTATTISRIVDDRRRGKGITNLYLCPLSTKPHVLGFTIFYLTECIGSASSIIFPFEEKYSRSASHGIGRVWQFRVEIP